MGIQEGKGDDAVKSLDTQRVERGFSAAGFHFQGKWDQKQFPLRAVPLLDNRSTDEKVRIADSLLQPRSNSVTKK